jgi:hypothetical protein
VSSRVTESSRPTLVYLYGPPAVGKLTVATELQARTSFRLFHNHLTVDLLRQVFDFGSEPYIEMLKRLRLDIFEAAAAAAISLIFTNNSIWKPPDARADLLAFADEARRRVEQAGGRVLFVQLTAPPEVLETRVAAASRRAHGKLLDPVLLRQMLARFDPSPLHHDDLVIDTSVSEPDAAAEAVVARLRAAAADRS